MIQSREQKALPPDMTNSWMESVSRYSELEGDNALLASSGSVQCLNWNTRDTGRAESPLRFDHEEILKINEAGVCAMQQGEDFHFDVVLVYIIITLSYKISVGIVVHSMHICP